MDAVDYVLLWWQDKIIEARNGPTMLSDKVDVDSSSSWWKDA